MTQQEFNRLIPGKSILKTEINGVEQNVLFKAFLCNPDDFSGYWILATNDTPSPEPFKILDTDFQKYAEECEVVSF